MQPGRITLAARHRRYGYGIIGILVIILLVVLILYFVRRV